MSSLNQIDSNAKAERNRPLNRSLLFWFLSLSLIPMIGVSWLSYQQSATDFRKNAVSRLSQTADLKVKYVNDWFNNRAMDLAGQAESQAN